MFAAGVEALSDFVSVLVSVFISGLVSDLVNHRMLLWLDSSLRSRRAVRPFGVFEVLFANA